MAIANFYDFENNPHDVPDDVMDKVYEGDPQAIADALCCIQAFTHYNTPAMYRLDMQETVLEQARLALLKQV
jgi:hypothetical protein